MKKLTIEEIARARLSFDEAQEIERFPVWVLLDDIRSLYNVGSIFRTADAARVEKMLLCGITGHPPRKEIDKTALGAADTVPWEYHPRAVEALRQLRQKNIPVIALEHTDHSQSYWEFDFSFPCCLVIGNEVKGIQDAVLEQVDAAVEIPMFGTKHSLNASVAFGIMIYEMLARYSEKSAKKII